MMVVFGGKGETQNLDKESAGLGEGRPPFAKASFSSSTPPLDMSPTGNENGKLLSKTAATKEPEAIWLSKYTCEVKKKKRSS